jgi:hypothetical protein
MAAGTLRLHPEPASTAVLRVRNSCKHRAEEAPLADEIEAAVPVEADNAAEPANKDEPERRSSRQKAVASVHAAAVAAAATELEGEEVPRRSLPQRRSAVSSPAGKRRRLTGMLQLAVAAEQVQISAAEAAAREELDEAEEAWAAECGVAVSDTDEPIGVDSSRWCQLLLPAAASCSILLGLLPNVCLCPIPPAQADELPPHLVEVRAAVAEAHVRNRRAIEAVRRPKGVAKDFAVGNAVLLLPPKRGRVGSTIDPRKIVCRVVDVTNSFGYTKYKLRCNAGVLPGQYAAAALEKAPHASEEKLRFEGTAVEGVPTTSLDKAVTAETGGATVFCECRGACGKRCPCKQHGVTCSRGGCNCKTCNGLNCGNY